MRKERSKLCSPWIGKSRDYLEADDNDASTRLIHKRSLITCCHAFLAFCVVFLEASVKGSTLL